MTIHPFLPSTLHLASCGKVFPLLFFSLPDIVCQHWFDNCVRQWKDLVSYLQVSLQWLAAISFSLFKLKSCKEVQKAKLSEQPPHLASYGEAPVKHGKTMKS